MDTTEQLAAALSRVSALVDHLWHGQLELPVAGGGTVHQTLDRMMVMGAAHTYWLRGDEAPRIEPPAVYGWVPAAEFREVMDDLVVAARDRAADDRELRTPIGRMTGTALISMILVGAVLNGQCLAAATGQPFEVPADVLATVDPFAPSAVGATRPGH